MPDTLAARVLKAKYFPRCEFLQAAIKRESSFLWKSIVASRELLKKGLRWRVGDGKSINIWNDPWVPRPSSFKVLPLHMMLWPEATVGDLINYEAGTWNIQILKSLLHDMDVDVIKRIPLFPWWPRDEVVWHFSKSGSYEVKSAYYLALQLKNQLKGEGSSSCNHQQRHFWTTIWHLKVPPKIKMFLWRACSGILPSGQNLQKRIKRRIMACSRCGCSDETDKHIFFNCTEARRVWKMMRWRSEVNNPTVSSFKEWIGLILKKQEGMQVELLILLLWLIWKSRNAALFNGASWGAEKICMYAQHYLQEYQAAMNHSEVRQVQSTNQWMPPPPGYLKINVDGAFSPKGAAIGLVARNDKGDLEAIMMQQLADCFDAEHVETLAMVKAAQFAKEYGITHFVLEGDASRVITQINNEEDDLSAVGHIIAGLKLLLAEFPSVLVNHVKRKSNEPAHIAAKMALNYEGCKVWFINFPKDIMDAVNNDLL